MKCLFKGYVLSTGGYSLQVLADFDRNKPGRNEMIAMNNEKEGRFSFWPDAGVTPPTVRVSKRQEDMG